MNKQQALAMLRFIADLYQVLQEPAESEEMQIAEMPVSVSNGAGEPSWAEVK